MNRARLRAQRDWLQQRVNSGGRSFSPWDALELLDALLDAPLVPACLACGGDLYIPNPLCPSMAGSRSPWITGRHYERHDQCACHDRGSL